MASAKDDFKFRIVLTEETFQITFQHRLHPMEGLQDADKRKLRYGSPFISRFFAKPPCRDHSQEQVGRAGEESENRADEKHASHGRRFESKYFPPLSATTWTAEGPASS